MASPSTSPQLVLVHGAFAGGWMWADVVGLLEQHGVGSVVVDLPTNCEDAAGTTFADDIAAVRTALDAVDGPVVVAAHSYGGAVVSAAAAGPHPAVRELVYVAAAAPPSGGSMASASAAAAEAAGQGPDAPDAEGGGGPVPREDGLLVFPPEVARQALFNDCDDARAEQGLAGLRPQSMAGTDEPIPTAAWTQLPTVYVRGEQDLVPRAIADDFLDRCAEVVDLPTGHCPQWSRPELVAEVLATRVAGTTTA